MNEELEKRMYALVPYNIMPMQQGIQAGHAIEQYAHKYATDETYIDYIENWKTWIILNGGTTNRSNDENGDPKGTLDQLYRDILIFNSQYTDGGIKYAIFKEPDLNDALTAICMVVDERVFNKEDYPDFIDWLGSRAVYISHTWETKLADEEKLLKEYEEFVGGSKIVFLRELLNNKRKA